MTEISRSEAIKVLEKSWSYENEINHAHYKAISDMEKLEKIEKVIKCYLCALDECGEKTECSEGYLIKIEKILRG